MPSVPQTKPTNPVTRDRLRQRLVELIARREAARSRSSVALSRRR